jgi:DNA-binding NarL/FixJ family response regulator
VAEGIKSLLKEEFELVGTVGDGRALLEAARQLRPDVIVTDIAMPLLNGLDAARQLKKERHPAKVVFLTMHSDPHLAAEAMRAGASGYLLKHSAGEELITAIYEALRGRLYLTPLITKELVEVLDESERPSPEQAERLTSRRREVLKLVAEGRTMKEVASILKISTRTAESHKYEIMRELGVQTTAQMVRYAVKIGLVEP